MHSRRMLAVAVPLLVGTLLTASCSSDEPSSASEQEPEAAASGGAFPVTVAHKYGETTVTEEPVRVVTVGVTEQDIVLQLGVTPIAVTEWYGERPFATWPWAEDLLGDAEPEVLSVADGFEVERIAALDPDLIVGTNSGMTKKEYELFAQLAPTIPAVEGSTPYFSAWRDQTVQIAKALGKEAEGQAIVDDIDARYAEVAAAHPEWAGQTATFSQGGPYDGELYVYPPGLSTDFLTDLGFTITTGFEDYAPEVGAQAADLRRERRPDRRRRPRLRHREHRDVRRAPGLRDRRQPRGGRRQPRRLHRRRPGRRDLLRHPAGPRLHPRQPRAHARARRPGRGPAGVPGG